MGNLQKIQSCHLFLLCALFPFFALFLSAAYKYLLYPISNYLCHLSFPLALSFQCFYILRRMQMLQSVRLFQTPSVQSLLNFSALSKIWQSPVVCQAGEGVSKD